MRHHATVCRAHHPATIRNARPCHRSGNAETCQRSGAPADHCQPEHAQACHKPHRGTKRPQAGKISQQQENRHTEPQRERTPLPHKNPHRETIRSAGDCHGWKNARTDPTQRRHAKSHRTHGNSASHTRTALPPQDASRHAGDCHTGTRGGQGRTPPEHTCDQSPCFFPKAHDPPPDFRKNSSVPTF